MSERFQAVIEEIFGIIRLAFILSTATAVFVFDISDPKTMVH